MKSLSQFAGRLNNFNDWRIGEQIDAIAYYHDIVLKKGSFTSNDIALSFDELRIHPHSNLSQYLSRNSVPSKGNRIQKFLKSKIGYRLELRFSAKAAQKFTADLGVSFREFEIDTQVLDWNPIDVPLLNSKERKSAHFFTKLYFLFYHLENSIRKLLSSRLLAIYGQEWEIKLISTVDLAKAESLRREASISDMIPNRGDNILFYCMWDDYGKILDVHRNIFSTESLNNEIRAHMSTLTKIRNAIAHNAHTVPRAYQDEMTVFLNKFISILK